MKESLTVVTLTEVLTQIGFSAGEEQDIRDYGFSPVVTWGDARYTLVGALFALGRILYALDAVYYEPERPSRGFPTEQDVTDKFWAFVDEDDYIDLEN